MTYYDKVSGFFASLKERPLHPETQLLYLHLLFRFNETREELKMTDRELQAATGLTKRAITEAKRVLKNSGLISFEVGAPREGTIYTLPPIDDISASVRYEWVACAAEEPNLATRQELKRLEATHGAAEVAAAIRRAHINKKYEHINLYMVKRQLGRGEKVGGIEKCAGQSGFFEETELPSGYGED